MRTQKQTDLLQRIDNICLEQAEEYDTKIDQWVYADELLRSLDVDGILPLSCDDREGWISRVEDKFHDLLLDNGQDVSSS